MDVNLDLPKQPQDVSTIVEFQTVLAVNLEVPLNVLNVTQVLFWMPVNVLFVAL